MTQTDGEIYRVLRLEESVQRKWIYYPKQSIDLIQFFFLTKKFQNLYGDTNDPEYPKQSSRKKIGAGGINLPDFRLYYKATVLYWHKDRNIDQWKKTESLEINPYTYVHRTFDKSDVAQSCPTLCDPMDCSPPGSSIHGILQARILEWVAISFSRGTSQPRDRTWVSCIGGRRFTLWATEEAVNLLYFNFQKECYVKKNFLWY